MTTLPNQEIDLIEQNPEVKSFIYQQIADFQHFVTPETVIAVIARNPLKLALQYEAEGREFDKAAMKKLYRIGIVLNEGGAKVEAEGVHADIFEAIKLAKENLLKELITIHDSVVSHQDRLIEINHYLQHPVLH